MTPDFQRLRTLKVLYAEDEAELRTQTARLLEKFFDTVDEAPDGKTALELFRERGYDVLVTDLRMPELHGRELLREARALEPELFTVVTTASDGHREETLPLADVYLDKPVGMEELRSLLGKMAAHFARKRGSRPRKEAP